jgi:hypothetical protein
MQIINPKYVPGRFGIITLISFVLLCVLAVSIIVYYANVDVKANCLITGNRLNITECKGDFPCGYMKKRDGSQMNYNQCVCYGGFVELQYMAYEDLTISSTQVQFDIINPNGMQESLNEYYPNNEFFACYFNKFDTTNVYFNYDDDWSLILIPIIPVSLIVAELIALVDKTFRSQNKGMPERS